MSKILDRVRHERSDDGAPDDIEMYVIESTTASAVGAHPVLDVLQTWRVALTAVQDHARAINAPDGFMPPPVDFPTLTGFREDVRVTLPIDPREAGSRAVTGALFDTDLDRLRVDASSLRTHKTELSWDASLRTSPWRRRDAILRIAPSPSFHLTVIRLTPVKSQRVATRAFIRAGLRAAYALAAQLERGHPGRCLPRVSNPEPMD